MRVNESQYKYFIKRPVAAGTLTMQHFRHRKHGCQVVRHTRFGTNEFVAASIDGKRFYVTVERTSSVITEAAKRALDYIGNFEKRNKRTPTEREIAKAFKISLNAIRARVEKLRDGGYITKKYRVEGSIRMVPQECPICSKKTDWPYGHECGN